MDWLLRKLKTAAGFSWVEWGLFAEAYGLLLKNRLFLTFATARSVAKKVSFYPKGNHTPGPSGSTQLKLAAANFNYRSPQYRANIQNQMSRGTSPYSQTELLRFFQLARRYQRFPPLSCLAVTLARRAFFSRHGLEMPLRIGIKKENGQLKAHAWCEEAWEEGREFRLLE